MNLEGARILITGGTGSLGNELTKRILESYSHTHITVLSRDEKKHYDMMNRFERYTRLAFVIGNVQDYATIRKAVNKADLIIHACAMKHVPHCEAFPMEAVRTNIWGASNVVRAIEETNGSKKAIFVSTDKAVDPVNVYGMTKAIQEKIFQQGAIMWAGVRYGNVLSSSGSVIPFFRSLAKEGKDLPVTSLEMTRFFITFDQAVNLIFKAIKSSEPHMFIPRLTSAKVIDIAEIFCEEYGVNKYVSGIRPGEKLHEILMTKGEGDRTLSFDHYCTISPAMDKFKGGEKHDFNQDAFRSDYPLMSREELKSFLELNNQL